MERRCPHRRSLSLIHVHRDPGSASGDDVQRSWKVNKYRPVPSGSRRKRWQRRGRSSERVAAPLLRVTGVHRQTNLPRRVEYSIRHECDRRANNEALTIDQKVKEGCEPRQRRNILAPTVRWGFAIRSLSEPRQRRHIRVVNIDLEIVLRQQDPELLIECPPAVMLLLPFDVPHHVANV